jgi:phenylpropionate dioxygenase-like ring-hydroxylating dioxygenase large terminal subunit
MRTLTTSADYREPGTFEREMTRIFEHGWQFAAFARDLAGDRDYVVAQIGTKSVLLQNFEGELKAFLNVCTHRFSAIRPDCKGNGPLQCQYHGWVFDAAGLPAGIASVKEFDDITPERRQELALERWDTDRCGELVFVRKSGTGQGTLRDCLGPAWEKTEAIGSALGERIDLNRMIVNANWKVAVENTLESYHVRSVHPESFALLNARTVDFGFPGPHTSWTAAIDEVMTAKLRKLMKMLGISSNFDGYFHQLIFPALTLATTSGMTYAIQTFRPVSPTATEFTSHVFAAKEPSAAKKDLLINACAPAAEFNRKVFEEDRVVCEEVQRGIGQAPTGWVGELSREERRVADFQREWKQLLAEN